MEIGHLQQKIASFDKISRPDRHGVQGAVYRRGDFSLADLILEDGNVALRLFNGKRTARTVDAGLSIKLLLRGVKRVTSD